MQGFDLSQIFNMMFQFKMMDLIFGGGGGGGLFGGMGGGGGGGGMDASALGGILNSQADNALLTALTAALANPNGLGASSASAGSATQGGKDILAALQAYASSQKTAALVAALSDGSGGNSAALAIALAG